MKDNAKIALFIVAIIAAGVIFWKLVAALMWIAYYAGMQM